MRNRLMLLVPFSALLLVAGQKPRAPEVTQSCPHPHLGDRHVRESRLDRCPLEFCPEPPKSGRELQPKTLLTCARQRRSQRSRGEIPSLRGGSHCKMKAPHALSMSIAA